MYHDTNLSSLIICSIFSGDIYLSFGISLLTSSFSECNSLEDFFDEFVTISIILIPIKSSVVSTVFRIALFEGVFTVSVVHIFALS